MQSKERQKALLFLVLTAVLWSLGGLLIKLVNWNAVAIAGGRSAIAALMMLAVIRRPRFKWSFPLVGGAVMYAGTVILFVMSNKLTTAANAILLQYTAPIYVAVFGAWILKERAVLLDWAAIVMAIGGMVLFFIGDISAGDMLGNVLAILSGVSFAFLAIFLRMQKDGNPMESTFLGNVLTALIGLPFMVGGGMPDTKSLLGLMLLGVVQLGLSYILYSIAIKNVTALEAILIPFIEPLLNPIWVLLLIGEKPGGYALLGGLIVLASVLLRSIISLVKKDTADVNAAKAGAAGS